MRAINLSILILFSIICYATGNYTKTSTPIWVKTISYSENNIVADNGGYQYLLIDQQDNIPKESYYRHYAVKVFNAEGIQSVSDINMNFDPAYQQLEIHRVRIIRNGQIIDKINDNEIQVLQREKSLERSLYDGSLSVIINLTDVRENDIIDYAYTVIGFNPIKDGNYSRTFYHQFSIPVSRVYNRLITKNRHQVQYKLYDGASDPKIRNSGKGIEYEWDIEAIDYELYDNNVPAWFNAHKRVSFTTFDKWEKVVNWALPLYTYSTDEIDQVKKLIKNSDLKEDKIIAMIRLVQDDIRYLGFESGISAYKPNNPSKVFNQRYGDCKDKSLLLVSLLRSEGIEAYPLWVNTELKQEVQKQLPGNNAFNHCVVYFNYHNKEYFIDPTISNQGGDLYNISFPNYKIGLLIKSGQKELIQIPDGQPPTLDINETISVNSVGGRADFVVRSVYSGSKSDFIRSYFATSSRESVKKEYLNYYSNLYPSIEISEGIKLIDADRNSSNKIIVIENYTIPEFWLDSDDLSYIYCETYPLILESMIDYTNSAGREMPYFLGSPFSFSQSSMITMPEDWIIENYDIQIAGEGFNYENFIKRDGREITVTHNYKLTKEFISGDSVSTFLEKHEDIMNELSYYFTYDQSLDVFKLSWISTTLAILAIVIGIFFSIKIYRDYNPRPFELAQNNPIGGWLVLPGLGLIISPIVLGFQVFTEDHFNHNSWVGVYDSGFEQTTALMLLFGAEIVYNFLFVTFSILVLILFFQRRSSVPKLISIFYIISFLVPAIDLFLSEQILPGSSTDAEKMASYKSIARSLIAAAIWVPYFHVSQRVKNTFCITYRNKNLRTDTTSANDIQ